MSKIICLLHGSATGNLHDEHGNHCCTQRGRLEEKCQRQHRGYIGIIRVHIGVYIGIMEKKMETVGIIGVI